MNTFLCGPPKGHKCDADGPAVVGGENPDGSHWQGEDTEENRKRASWASVSCSVCGMTAIERSMWDGP